MKYRACIELDLGVIEASSYEKARKIAEAIRDEIATSNDGSEMIANATVEIEDEE